MKSICHIAHSLTRRSVQSLAGLVAVFLLQGPLMVGLAIASGACCSGDHCSIAAHHHAVTKAEEMPMDCDHNMDQGVDKMRFCTMSCCSSTEQSAVHSNVFLLSPAIELASANPLPETVSGFDASETIAPFAPLSPPPKSLPSLI